MKEDSGRHHYDLRSIWKAYSSTLKCQREHQTGEDGGVLSQPISAAGLQFIHLYPWMVCERDQPFLLATQVRFVHGEIDQYRCSE